MLSRIFRALKLDSSLYNEVESDPKYNSEAYIIVAIAALLSGIGGGFTLKDPTNPGAGIGWSFTGALLNIIIALIGFVVMSYIVYLVGTRLFGGTADTGEMRRTLGFAYAANFIGILPCIGCLAFPWMIATFFVATREGLDLDNTKAALTAIISVVIWLIIVAILGIFGVGIGAGFGALMGR